jgi:hypothetical protein
MIRAVGVDRWHSEMAEMPRRSQSTSKSLSEAKRCFERALEIASQQHARSYQLQAATSLARLALLEGNHQQARTVLRRPTVFLPKGSRQQTSWPPAESWNSCLMVEANTSHCVGREGVSICRPSSAQVNTRSSQITHVPPESTILRLHRNRPNLSARLRHENITQTLQLLYSFIAARRV